MPELPLLERVKLCAIFSSNLDEFVAVRLAGVGQQVESKIRRRSVDGRTPARDSQSSSRAHRRAASRLRIGSGSRTSNRRSPPKASASAESKTCSPRELRALTKRFEREIQPLLTPIAVGVAAPFPNVTSLTLNIGLLVRDDEVK